MDENNKPSKRASVTTLTSKAVDERSKWLVKISLHFQVLLRPAKRAAVALSSSVKAQP